MKFLLSALLAIVTAGCGTFNSEYNARTVNMTELPKDRAVIILSTGAAERCISFATILKVSPAGTPYNKGGVAAFYVDAYTIKSDFADHQGNLQTVSIPAGSYYLSPWAVNPYLSAVKVPKAEFSVSAGEVVYLGEYYMPVACSLNTVASFRDQQERDVALLIKQNPEFARATIIKRIPKFSGYAFGSDQ